MITFDATYTAAVSAPNAVTDWLLELTNDAPGTMYLSSGDHTVSGTLYHGLVRDWGSIDESLDLKKCKIKVSDVTITVDNTWHNASGRLGAELFAGTATDNYLYQDVVIRAWSPELTSADLSTAIFYRGRLIDVEETDNGMALKLTIEPRHPWDFIKIPQDKTTEGVYYPLAYGAYQPETSTVASPQLCEDAICWPMPVNEVAGGSLYALSLHSISANGSAHYWDKNLNLFIPFDDVDLVSEAYRDAYAIKTDVDLDRGFKSREVTENADNDWDDFANLITAGSDYTTAYDDIGESDIVDYYLRIDAKQPDGYISAVSVQYDWEIDVDAVSGSSHTMAMTLIVGGALVGSIGDRSTVGQTAGSDDVDISAYCGGGSVPSIARRATFATGAGSTIAGTFKVNSFALEIQCNINTDEPEAVAKRLADIKHVYSGASGAILTHQDAPATTVAQLPHDIYRDLLSRFTGVDIDDDDIISGWADTDTARAGWNCRLWELEPVKLFDVLERLQFEGQFIWQQHGAKARIIPLLETYSSSDVDLEGWEIDNLKVGHTSFRDIESKRIYSYNRHPANDDYQSTYTAGNAENGNRANWGFADEENVVEVELRYLVASVDDLATVQNKFFGEPRLMFECDVVNPAKFNIEVGDKLACSSMPREPLGGTFTSTYWMVEKSRREPDKLQITARQVG